MFELGVYEYFEDENLALLRQAPSANRVLDIGCGSGLLGARLRETGNTVWGIDSSAAVQAAATERLDRFLLADLSSADAVSAALGDNRFEVLVFADVLEHLVDPVATVRAYSTYLEPGGRILISVPNVAVWYVRLGLLAGRFEYAPTGTLDRTHLRFFTRRNLLRLLRETGFEVDTLDVNPGLARVLVGPMKQLLPTHVDADRRALIDSPLYRLYLRFVHPWELWLARRAPGLFAFQYVVTARRRDTE